MNRIIELARDRAVAQLAALNNPACVIMTRTPGGVTAPDYALMSDLRGRVADAIAIYDRYLGRQYA